MWVFSWSGCWECISAMEDGVPFSLDTLFWGETTLEMASLRRNLWAVRPERAVYFFPVEQLVIGA